MFPASRNNKISNSIRQFIRFGEGARLSGAERYWRWAGYAQDTEANRVLSASSQEKVFGEDYTRRKNDLLRIVGSGNDMNNVLLADMQMVLPNDMLFKTDLMSMANGLEVRSPFLDTALINFCFTLPYHFKINGRIRKRILQDSYRDFLPPKLYNRPKKGFEVPLLKWFRKEMKSMIFDDLLSQKYIEEQGIFYFPEISKLKHQLFSRNPGDVHARIWALVVFQWWHRKYVG
jgi:asparagine synthase (glutamine-hydrolysing)